MERLQGNEEMTSRQRERAAKCYAKMCRYLGIPLAGETEATPLRVVKALEEMTINQACAAGVLPFNFSLFESVGDEVVVLKNMDFTSVCEHHHMPFHGKAFVGYLPDKQIVGLSKIPRLVDFYSKMLGTQERLTAKIADELYGRLACKGLLVKLKAVHMCICARGIRSLQCTTVTTAVRGPVGLGIKEEVLREFENG
jgi:GTP cyclohydrolase I